MSYINVDAAREEERRERERLARLARGRKTIARNRQRERQAAIREERRRVRAELREMARQVRIAAREYDKQVKRATSIQDQEKSMEAFDRADRAMTTVLNLGVQRRRLEEALR